jgi:two-component system sensor histidine kinase KdpD
LAQQLGAIVFTYRGEDIVKTVLEFAKEYRVGHIVIGRPGRRLPFWRRLLGQSNLVERLVEEGGGMTIVVLDTQGIETRVTATPVSLTDGDSVVSSQAGRDLRLSHLLSEHRILLWNTPPSKDDAIQGLVEACIKDLPGFTQEALLQVILEREKQGTTFFNEGVGFPHGRINGLPRSVVALGIAPKGVVDPETGVSVQLVFLVLTPAHYPQIKILAEISRLAKDPFAFQRLVEAKSPERVCSILRAWDASAVNQ